MKRLIRTTLVASSLLLGLASMHAERVFASWPKLNGEYPADMPHIAEAQSKSDHMRVDKLGNSKWDNTDGHDLREVVTEGEMRVLVILVNFADYKYSVTEDPRSTIDDMLNLPGFDFHDATGSVIDYFQDISFGKFRPVFDVYGPVNLDHPEVYYVKSETGETFIDEASGKECAVYPAGYMVEEAISKLDGEIDFSQYDANHDGVVDFIYFFHAGRGATDAGNQNRTNLIWPHAFTLKAALGRTLEADGVEINRYATSCEYNSSNRLMGIGMFVHEFSHVLGLPDLYDTANNNGQVGEVFSPGLYDCMDAGNYNNNIHTPPVYSSYERYAMEWMKPVEITGSANCVLLPLTAAEQAFKISSPTNPQEYFLFEARAPYSWDKYIAAHGLAVWHIDFLLDAWMNNRPNNQATHQRIDLVEADNLQSINNRNGDLFPGTANVCEFVSDMLPTFVTWNNRSTGYGVEQIRRYPDGAVGLNFVADSGEEMPGMAIAPVEVVRASKLSPTEATLQWDAAEGATDYRVVVYPAKAFDGVEISEFVSGCYFTSTDGKTALKVEGLDPETEYGVVVYSCSDMNVARSRHDYLFTTPAGEATEPLRAEATPLDGAVTVTWTPAEDAERYSVEICQLIAGASSETQTEPFSGNKLPEGWEGNGKMDDRAKYCGAEAPSYCFDKHTSWLTTPLFDKAVSSITFWCRQAFDEVPACLDVYAVENGVCTLIERFTEVSARSEGQKLTVNIPGGAKQLKFVFTMLATGLSLNIDDVELTFAQEWSEAPVQQREVSASEHRLYIDALANGMTYVAEVKALTADGEVLTTAKTKPFNPCAVFTGVEEIVVEGDQPSLAVAVRGGAIVPGDSNMVYSVYSADGRCIAKEVKGTYTLPSRGVYIMTASAGKKKLAW